MRVCKSLADETTARRSHTARDINVQAAAGERLEPRGWYDERKGWATFYMRNVDSIRAEQRLRVGNEKSTLFLRAGRPAEIITKVLQIVHKLLTKLYLIL